MTAPSTAPGPARSPSTSQTSPASADLLPDGDVSYRDHVAALIADYQRAVDTIMTNRYGPDWATRGDLPDDAYTRETIFSQWLNDLLDHIDHAARGWSRGG